MIKDKVFFSGLFLLLLLILVSLLSSCEIIMSTKVNETETPALIPEQNNTPDAVVCTVGWTCVNASTRGYQLKDCSWQEIKDCPRGCVNGTCRPAPPCTAGKKCRSSSVLAYQTENCSWVNETNCALGCGGERCLNSSDAGSQAQKSSSKPATIVSSIPFLNVGEKKSIDANGGKHNFSIYNIEEGRVIVSIDNRRSNWLNEGMNSSVGGVNITILGILFHSYAGGMQGIDYKILN